MAKQRPFDTRIGGSTEGIIGFVYVEFQFVSIRYSSQCNEWLCGKNSHLSDIRWPTGATAAHYKTNTFLIKTLLSLCNCSCFPYKYKPVA